MAESVRSRNKLATSGTPVTASTTSVPHHTRGTIPNDVPHSEVAHGSDARSLLPPCVARVMHSGKQPPSRRLIEACSKERSTMCTRARGSFAA